MNQRIFLSTVIALSFLSPAAHAKKKIEEYWKDVGLTIEDAGVSNTECNQDEKHFIACFHALNAALAFEKDHGVLVPASRVKAETGFGAQTKDFTSAVIVGAKKNNSDDFAVIYEAIRKEKTLSSDALVALYKNRASEPVDFDKIVDFVKQGVGFQAKESMAVGSMENAMLGVLLDPHTYIVPKAYMMDANTAGSDNFTGIGAVLKSVKKNGKTVAVIQQPFESGPGYKAGLRANDVITHVDGKDIEGMPLDELVGKIKGPKGTDVKLTVQRGADSLDITVTRDLIEVKNVEARIVGGAKEVGYIKLSDFMKRDAAGNTLVYSESKAGVEKVLKENPKGLIFDLRDNGGGLLTESVRIASMFLKKNSVVLLTKSLTGGAPRTFKTSDAPITDLPLVVLINARSASASEIVAGALQDQQRAYLIGERSFGKGSVQNVGPMPGSDKLLLARTVERFYQPSGRTNQVEGILPDIERFVKPNPSAADKVAFREEDEYAALPPVGVKWKQTRPVEVAKLETCMAKGSAQKEYEAEADADVPPDYQLLAAVDAVNCIADEKLWSPDDAAPVWEAPASKTPVSDFFKNLFGG